MKNTMLVLVTLLVSALAAPAKAGGIDVHLVVPVAPPTPKVVHHHHKRPGMIWIEGHWVWRRGHWMWKKGHWAKPPHARAVWIPGHWAKRPHGFVWVAGHWRV